MTDEGRSAQPVARRAEDPAAPGGLTIGDVAERTGVSPAVLRMWEARHGFPVPERMPSGHRRYTEADVELVQRVLRRKQAGTRLEVAISEAATASSLSPAPSVFAQLRRRHPAIAVQRLHKRTLIALSRAIEDECFAAASTPVVFGAFQESRFYRPAAARWAELARGARAAYVFAQEWPASEERSTRGPVRVGLATDAAMRREWAVVCDGGESTACLSAWELPGQGGVADRERIFEAVWTLDPAAVRDAARAAARVAVEAGAPGAEQVMAELASAPLVPDQAAGRGEALFGRVLAYVDQFVRP